MMKTPSLPPSARRETDFSGLRVVSFESRRAFEADSLIRRHGGEPLVAPSMREIPFEANPEALEFVRRLMDGKVEMLILTTGVGTGFLAQVAETRHPREAFAAALSKTTLVARGPKPVAALKELGLTPAVTAEDPHTWREIVAALDRGPSIKNKKVFVQEYGIPNRELIEELKKRGAHVTRIPIYRWALPDDLSLLRQAVRRVCDGSADAVLFSNATQIHHVLRVAAEDGLESSFREALRRVVVGSIGPVVSENLREAGLPLDFEAADSKLGLFVKEASEKCPDLLAEKRRRWAEEEKPSPVRVYPAKPFDDSAVRQSVFMKACRREKTPYTPLWIMRQAGRYMKEYRDLRARHGFLELCKNSDLACEVTVTAQEKLGVDAAILFSDILLILEPLGVGLEYTKGEGPSIFRPVRGPDDVEALKDVSPQESLPFVYDAVRKIRSALKPDIPLIGFAGAPFTVVSYMVEGHGSDHYLHTKTLMYRHPQAWNAMMAKVTEATALHLNGQIAAGAQAVQVFDSWIGCLSPSDYREFVQPHMKRLFAAIAPGVPAIHFGTDTASLLPLMREAGGSVIGLDWRVELGPTWNALGDVAVQGNLDPLVLLSDRATIRRKVKAILDEAGGRPGHIFNLGHGVLPQTPVENALALVEAVHELSGRRA
jgi:uroporphyrinogen decarboxylase